MQPDNLTNLSVDGHIPRTIKSTPKIHQPIIQNPEKKTHNTSKAAFLRKERSNGREKKNIQFIYSTFYSEMRDKSMESCDF